MRNIAFSKVLKMNGRVWEFNFRKLPGDDVAFHADFTDAAAKRVQFVLLKAEGGLWKIKGDVPGWLAEEAGVLREVIEEQVPMYA